MDQELLQAAYQTAFCLLEQGTLYAMGTTLKIDLIF